MIGLSISVRHAHRPWSRLEREQLPFGLSLGINQTLKDIQAAQRRGIQQRFTLRRPGFVLSKVMIGNADWAMKDRLVGRVRISGGDGTAANQTGAQSRGHKDFASKLTRHERGGISTGTPNSPGEWIPTAALRPSFSQLVPMRLWPSSLGITRTQRQLAAGTAGDARMKGKQRSFAIVKNGELLGVFQRFGLRVRDIKRRVRKGNAPTLTERLDEGIKMIWAHRGSIRIQPRLGFTETGRLVARTRMPLNVEQGLVKALRTARPR